MGRGWEQGAGMRSGRAAPGEQRQERSGEQEVKKGGSKEGWRLVVMDVLLSFRAP